MHLLYNIIVPFRNRSKIFGKLEKSNRRKNRFGVAIIGSGYAGHSAALLLGRYLIPTVMFDNNRGTRNSTSKKLHGYLGFEGSSPIELLQAAARNIARYKSVKKISSQVSGISKLKSGWFRVYSTEGDSYDTKFVIITTGVRDVKPKIENFERFDGNGAWHCPHCDGLESAGKRLAIIASGQQSAIDYAKEFLGWTDNILLILDSKEKASTKLLAEANRLGIQVIADEKLVRLTGGLGRKKKVLEMASGRKIVFDVLFYHLGYLPQSEIGTELGCKLDDEKYFVVDKTQRTSIQNVYAAGDVDCDRHYVVLAAAAGALAAIAIYESILKESIRLQKEKN